MFKFWLNILVASLIHESVISFSEINENHWYEDSYEAYDDLDSNEGYVYSDGYFIPNEELSIEQQLHILQTDETATNAEEDHIIGMIGLISKERKETSTLKNHFLRNVLDGKVTMNTKLPSTNKRYTNSKNSKSSKVNQTDKNYQLKTEVIEELGEDIWNMLSKKKEDFVERIEKYIKKFYQFIKKVEKQMKKYDKKLDVKSIAHSNNKLIKLNGKTIVELDLVYAGLNCLKDEVRLLRIKINNINAKTRLQFDLIEEKDPTINFNESIDPVNDFYFVI